MCSSSDAFFSFRWCLSQCYLGVISSFPSHMLVQLVKPLVQCKHRPSITVYQHTRLGTIMLIFSHDILTFYIFVSKSLLQLFRCHPLLLWYNYYCNSCHLGLGSPCEGSILTCQGDYMKGDYIAYWYEVYTPSLILQIPQQSLSCYTAVVLPHGIDI